MSPIVMWSVWPWLFFGIGLFSAGCGIYMAISDIWRGK